MTIETDVATIAKRFGIDAALIQAVVQAEGGGDAILAAVRCSVPTCKDRAQALEITCRSAVHAMSDFVKAEHADEFIEMWARRWAPRGVANDPHDLNANWVGNTSRGWLA